VSAEGAQGSARCPEETLSWHELHTPDGRAADKIRDLLLRSLRQDLPPGTTEARRACAVGGVATRCIVFTPKTGGRAAVVGVAQADGMTLLVMCDLAAGAAPGPLCRQVIELR
jgi:hypothetical protein